MIKELDKSVVAVEEAQQAMRFAMRALEALLNSDEIVDDKARMQIAEFADVCLSGSDMAVDVLVVLAKQ